MAIDRLFSALKVCSATALLWLSAASPAFSDRLLVWNAAGVSYGALAPGLSLFLTGPVNPDLAPGTVAVVFPGEGLPNLTPTERSQVTVAIFTHGSFAEVPLPILSRTAPLGFLIYLPRNVPFGRATITMRIPPSRVFTEQINVVSSSFTIAQYGVVIWNPPPIFSFPLQNNFLARPARPGDFITLRGSGLGLATADQVSILLNGRAYPAAYILAATEPLGVDQVTFQIPDDPAVPTGCYVQVQAKIGQRVSNVALFSISHTGAPCEHPLGLSAEELSRLDQGGAIPFGQISITSDIIEARELTRSRRPLGTADSDAVRLESAGAEFSRANSGDLANKFSGLRTPLAVDSPQPTGCSPDITPFFIDDDFFRAVLGSLLNSFSVGEVATLRGAKGRWLQLERSGFRSSTNPNVFLFATYASPRTISDLAAKSDDLPLGIFPGGEVELSVPGDSLVSASATGARLPGPAQLKSFDRLAPIDTSRDLTITWDPQNFVQGELVRVTFTRFVKGSGSREATCTMPAQAGRGTIPAGVLSALRPAPGERVDGYAEFSLVPTQPVDGTGALRMSDGTRIAVGFTFRSRHSFRVTFR